MQKCQGTSKLIKNVFEVSSSDREEVIEEMIAHMSELPEITDVDQFRQAVLERESNGTTGIGGGVAIPHAKLSSVQNIAACVGYSRQGINYGSVDDKPVYVIVMIAANAEQTSQYVCFMANLCGVFQNDKFKNALQKNPGIFEALKMLESF